MKQRFSSLDVQVIAHELSVALVSLRLANIYDLSSRIFLLKFAKPDLRQQILVESGFRCHLTDFSRATASAPSPFVSRLRKYLRTRRVTSVSQVGTDRILELQFSDGQYRLFFEFYAGGNIVLTDKDLNIIALLRMVPEGPDQEELRIGLKYSIENRQNYRGIPTLTPERVKDAIQKALDKGNDEPTDHKRKPRKKQGDTVRKAVSAYMNEFPPMLVDHAMRLCDFSADVQLQNVLEDDSTFDNLMRALEKAQEITRGTTSSRVWKGFIIAKASKSFSKEDMMSETPGRENLIYEDFHPFRPAQFEGNPETYILEFEGFNKTVDEFFSSIESQKLETRLNEREENARKKLDNARQDHENRLGGLQQAQQLNVRKAESIEANLRKVQEAIDAINGLIAQGMDWVEIARLIEIEQARQNPVAEMIKLPLKLYENTATLLLPELGFDAEDDYDGDETGSDVCTSDDDGPAKLRASKASKSADNKITVDIDLALSPWSNARQYYDQKKTAAAKEQKTIQSSGKALKNTERKINSDLKKGLKQEKQVMRPVRKQRWFEKFLYFISSEGYLILGGRDAQQNEILYKRYLKKGDVYVHADLHGAASVIVKNKPTMIESPIPPSTLSQAGTLAVATSSAWDSKAVMSAWWVRADQVSKTTPTGEYLTTGSFTIRGQKSFLPPAQLLLGFGLMFQISEESKTRHLKHRLVENGPDGPDPSSDRAQTCPGKADAVDLLEEIDDGSTIAQSDPNETSDPEIPTGGRSDATEEERGADNHAGNSSHSESDEIDEADRIGPDDERRMTEPGATPFEDQEPNDTSALARRNPLQPSIVWSGESSQDSDPEMTDDDLNGNDAQAHENGKDDGPLLPDIVATAPPPNVDRESASGVRHLSARERRLLRQNRQPQSDASKYSPHASSAVDSADLHPKPNSKPQALPVRGKHGKRNKIKTKYANQDEEDRALALQVLGSSAGQQKVADDAEAKAAKELELAAQKERRRKQHALAAEKGREAEEVRKLNMQEGIETVDDEIESQGDLDAFVGTALPGDEVLDVLVMCGPWDAIGSRCKWRAKLQPGATKKGKAVKEILGAWSMTLTAKDKNTRAPKGSVDEAAAEEEKRLNAREGELIKAIREPEVIGIVPVGKCRVIVGKGEASSIKGRGGAATAKGKRGGKGSKRV